MFRNVDLLLDTQQNTITDTTKRYVAQCSSSCEKVEILYKDVQKELLTYLDLDVFCTLTLDLFLN